MKKSLASSKKKQEIQILMKWFKHLFNMKKIITPYLNILIHLVMRFF